MVSYETLVGYLNLIVEMDISSRLCDGANYQPLGDSVDLSLFTDHGTKPQELGLQWWCELLCRPLQDTWKLGLGQ